MNDFQNKVALSLMREVPAADPAELFPLMAAEAVKLSAAEAGFSSSTLLAAIDKREQEATTALGGGLMMPHIRLEQLKRLCVVIAFPQNPLDFETPDEVPVDVVCLLLIPDSKPMSGLKFMADLANCVRVPKLHSELFAARSSEEVLALLLRVWTARPDVILAGDLMIPPMVAVTPETPLREVTSQMMRHHSESIPVLEGKKLVGELVASQLFTLGIPEFFSQLKSVGFIRFFDPFEKYFEVEAASRAGDVMNRDCCVFSPEATLIEVVFAISVEKRQQVYVVGPDRELLGVIDRALLLERILNL